MPRPSKNNETPESVAKQLADAEAKVQKLKDKMSRIENEAYVFTGKQMKAVFGESLPSDRKAQKAFISLLAELYKKYEEHIAETSETPSAASEGLSEASQEPSPAQQSVENPQYGSYYQNRQTYQNQ